MNGTASPARSPRRFWSAIAVTREVRTLAMSVQPAIVTAEAASPLSSTSFSNACHHCCPAIVRCALFASIDATSARRRFDSSSVGTRDVERHPSPDGPRADVERGEDREREEGDHGHDDEHHQERRDDHAVDPRALERAEPGVSRSEQRDVELRRRVGRRRGRAALRPSRSRAPWSPGGAAMCSESVYSLDSRELI